MVKLFVELLRNLMLSQHRSACDDFNANISRRRPLLPPLPPPLPLLLAKSCVLPLYCELHCADNVGEMDRERFISSLSSTMLRRRCDDAIISGRLLHSGGDDVNDDGDVPRLGDGVLTVHCCGDFIGLAKFVEPLSLDGIKFNVDNDAVISITDFAGELRFRLRVDIASAMAASL